jgi:hypothetical protein
MSLKFPFTVTTENSTYYFYEEADGSISCQREGPKPRLFHDCKLEQLEVGLSLIFTRDFGYTWTTPVNDINKPN